VGDAVALHTLTAFQRSPECLDLTISLDISFQKVTATYACLACTTFWENMVRGRLCCDLTNNNSQVCSLKASREKILW
jgi:hypothetical protein